MSARLLLAVIALFLPPAFCFSWRASSARVELAKSELRRALKENEGRTAAPAVATIIEKLVALTAGKVVASGEALAGASRTLCAPIFEDCLGTNASGEPIYTLGRMAFNVYEPVALQCAIKNIFQPIGFNTETGELSYDIDIEFTAAPDPSLPPLKGRMVNHATAAICSEYPNRLLVTFVGGTMRPAEDNEDLLLWKKTFHRQPRGSDMSEDGRLGW